MTPELWAAVQAAADTAHAYREFPVIGERAAVWIAAEVHLMFAAFVLGVTSCRPWRRAHASTRSTTTPRTNEGMRASRSRAAGLQTSAGATSVP